jgi:O-antigen ligase
VTHNYYLDQWFGLGLVGLFSFLTIQYQSVATGRRAIAVEEGRLRPYMIAFVFGTLGLAVCLFFGNLDKPWSYVWVYTGFTLRAAADILEKAARQAARPAMQPLARVSLGRAAPRAATGTRAVGRRIVGEVRR